MLDYAFYRELIPDVAWAGQDVAGRGRLRRQQRVAQLLFRADAVASTNWAPAASS